MALDGVLFVICVVFFPVLGADEDVSLWHDGSYWRVSKDPSDNKGFAYVRPDAEIRITNAPRTNAFFARELNELLWRGEWLPNISLMVSFGECFKRFEGSTTFFFSSRGAENGLNM